jgi:hypothetical protein
MSARAFPKAIAVGTNNVTKPEPLTANINKVTALKRCESAVKQKLETT